MQRRREALGYSVNTVAAACDVSEWTARSWEREGVPQGMLALDLAEVLECSVHDLVVPNPEWEGAAR